MATWRDENEKKDYTLRQALKEIENKLNLNSLYRDDFILQDDTTLDDNSLK